MVVGLELLTRNRLRPLSSQSDCYRRARILIGQALERSPSFDLEFDLEGMTQGENGPRTFCCLRARRQHLQK